MTACRCASCGSGIGPGLLFEREFKFFIYFLMRSGNDQKAEMRQPSLEHRKLLPLTLYKRMACSLVECQGDWSFILAPAEYVEESCYESGKFVRCLSLWSSLRGRCCLPRKQLHQ